MNKLVPDKSNCSSRELGHVRHFNGLIAGHLRFDQFERIGWRRDGLGRTTFLRDCGFALKYAINFARIRAEEGKAADALAADNGFEEKRGRFVPNLGVSA